LSEPDQKTLNVTRQRELLDLSRSGYYRWADPAEGEPEKDLGTMRLIDELYTLQLEEDSGSINT